MLAPGKKSYDTPTLPTKICIVKAMVFPIVKYECESWAIKKAELRKFDAFELWCWRRLLRVLLPSQPSVLELYLDVTFYKAETSHSFKTFRIKLPCNEEFCPITLNSIQLLIIWKIE